jgi:MurNAc alpha-1-phosphate uridylyltransferase
MKPIKALILAAGRGSRLQPFTDHTPKPLAEVRGKALIEYHLDNLCRVGVREVVINLGWLGERIREFVGDGRRWGMTVAYSNEGWPALETGGGVFRALPLLQAGGYDEQAFIVVNADVYAPDYSWSLLSGYAQQLPKLALAHLVLVPNPDHNPDGDFELISGKVKNRDSEEAGEPLPYTFSGISLLHPTLFAGCQDGAFQLAPLLRRAADRDQVQGEIFEGAWSDVGTPERWALLNRSL